MMPPKSVPILALALLLVPTVGAGHGCNGEVATIGTGSTVLHVDDRSDAFGDTRHWLYLESNGQEGLQSGGDMTCLETWPYVCETLWSDPCPHADPDTLLLRF